jgi:hypothetical protein
MSGVAGVDKGAVEKALLDFARQHSGTFERLDTDEGVRDDEILLIAESGQGNVTVMYPDRFLKWVDASRHLSAALRKPVFSFHIEHGDLWMYLLFDNGEEVDRFNPMPDYWRFMDDDADPESWAGNVDIVCKHWPNVRSEQIANYLVGWDIGPGDEEGIKAYPDDEFEIGRDWQMADFMAKVGLVNPANEAQHDRSHISYARFSIIDPDADPRVKPLCVPAKSWWQRLFK